MIGSIMAILRPLAYLSLPYFALRWVSSQSPTAKYYLRTILYLSGIGVFSFWGVIVSIWAVIMGKRYDINYYIARSFAKCMGPLLGISYEIEGAEHLETRPSVIVGNHQTMLDLLYLGA
jgi:lysophosphatidate acyltransferase